MAEAKKSQEQVANERVEHENELTFEDRVLEKIANYSVQNIDGILELKGNFTSGFVGFFSDSAEDTKGVSAEVGKEEVALDLEVIAEYGKDLQKAFQQTIDVVTRNVKSMTGLKVVEINMNVNDVVTRGEFEREQNEERRKKAEERKKELDRVRDNNEQGKYSDGSRVQ
ncbi:MAG: Asp23/Gls24 family envelope stress response protein [Aerococcus sp.]|nr:Asp23/Gls24 family envelope stress response protein [Aerococcus sp.]